MKRYFLLFRVKQIESEINKKMIEIQEIAKEISDDTINDKYSQKAKCCPTFLKLVRNYFF